MKHILPFLIATSVILIANPSEDDPFAPPANGAVEYNPDKSIVWEDEIIEFGGQDKFVKWSSISALVYKGRSDKIAVIEFCLDEKDYSEAVNHPDHNRGVLLSVGKGASLDLFTFLRPIRTVEGKVHFYIKASSHYVDKMYIGFIPGSGKKRFLYQIRNFR